MASLLLVSLQVQITSLVALIQLVNVIRDEETLFKGDTDCVFVVCLTLS